MVSLTQKEKKHETTRTRDNDKGCPVKMIQRAASMTLKTSAACLLLTVPQSLAAQELPSFKVGNAPLVSVSAAQTYYYNKTIPVGIYDPGTSRAAELRDLARALKYDPDLIYAYVHDRIRFVPQYGLQKGALGTHIDEAGTAFDQAQLMVELLRESGFTTTYVFGTLNLNGGEFDDWIGVTDARAACEILADGGIPASVNSASSCGSVSGNVSSVTMAHVWVSVSISGQTVQFDPSYKTHAEIAPRIGNLATAMGYGGQAGFLSLAGGTTGSIAGAPTLRGINNTAINTELDRLADNLITEIRKTENYDASLEELIGGRDIVPTTATSQRLTSLPNHTVSSSSLTEIPDAYRNILTLNIRTTTGIGFTKTFFGDDIYGRRLTLDWVGTSAPAVDEHPSVAYLRLDDVTIGQFTQVQHNAEARKIEYVLDHNYAANGGNYMDRTYRRYTGGVSQPVSFVIGFGPVSGRMMAKLSGERINDYHHPGPQICEDQMQIVWLDLGTEFQESKLSESVKTQVAYGWLAQLSRSVDLHGEVHDSVIQHHHSIGAVVSTTHWTNLCTSVPESPTQVFFPRDKAMQIDVITGISVNEENGDAVLSRATANSIAVAAATLEGSVFEQFADQADPASVTERFEWFNTERTTHNFHIVDSASVNAVQAALPGGDNLSGLSWVDDYANAGYLVIAPQRGDLGPGAENGPPIAPGSQSYGPSFERGHAFYAIKPDGSDIAHIVFTGGSLAKGGGASDAPDDGTEFDPDMIADILRDRFEDRSRLHGVDLATGDVAYSPPPDISTGSGDFPYSLSFQRSFAATGGRSRGMGVGWRHNWDITASYSGSGTEAMGKTKALRAVPSLVAMLVTQDIIAGRTMNMNDDADSLKRLLAPVFVSHWWREHLHHNVVTVQQGAVSTQFVRLPNGDFDPPPASNTELVQTGAPYTGYPAPPHSCDGPTVSNGACKRIYHYDNVTFEVHSVDGNVLHIDGNKGAMAVGVRDNPNVPQFWATRWTFPDGIELKFEYSSDEHVRLNRVVSNLGGSTSTFTGPDISFNWTGEEFSVNAKGASAGVTFTYANAGNLDGTRSVQTIGFLRRDPNRPVLMSVSNSAGELTTYRYVGNGINTGQYDTALNRNDWFPRLHEVYRPLDGDPTVNGQAKPSLRFTYDHSWRAKDFADAVEIEYGGRGTWDFHIVPGYRGERVAPSVDNGGGLMVRPSYSVSYDEKARPVLFVDENGNPYSVEHDGLGRVTARTMPEGNQVKFEYDAFHNVTELRQVSKTGPSALPDIVVTGTYLDSNWPTKPTAVTDANGNTTDIAYRAPSTLGAGSISTVTQPSVSGGRPVYTYTYNAFGQLATTTDPEGMVTRNTYDTAGHLDTVVVDEGGFNLTTGFDFDLQGNQTLVDGPRTDVVDTTTQTWDAMRRPWVTTDALNRKIDNEYDANGQLIRTEQRDVDDSLLSVTETDYTATGQVESTYNEECFTAAGIRNTGLANCGRTQFSYDAMDRESVVTDPAGRKSKTLYDPASQVLKLVRAYQTTQTYSDGTSLQQDYATYTYTDNGQADTVKDANGNLTRYDFDNHDRLERTEFPHPTNIGTSNPSDYEQYAYDPNGNLLGKRTRKGDWILNAYDGLNRQVRKLTQTLGSFSGIAAACGSSGNDTCYEYDRVGRQEQVKFGNNAYVIDYGYDTAGRLTSVTDDGRTIGYGYDQAANRDEIVWPDGYSAHYYYDALNRLDTIRENSTSGPLLADYDYDNRSRRETLQFGNNLTTTYGYFPDSALNTLEHNLTGTGNDVLFTFGFNKANQVTSINLTNSTYEYGSSASRL